MAEHEEQFSEFLTEYRKDGFKHDSYTEIFDALNSGDAGAIEAMDPEIFISGAIGRMSDDPVTQARYLVVVVCTLASTIAMEHGVESEVALSLPDYYCLMAQRINNVRELSKLTKDILIHYCEIIYRQQNIPYSDMIKRVIEYIYNNIYSMIYANDIARAFRLNPSYLSKIFREETGIHLKEYIQQAKLKEARNLIRYSNMSLTEIAMQLGYSDLSHFTKVCRTYAGCTPKQLRGQVRREERGSL